MHWRELMTYFLRIYRWLSDLDENVVARWPFDVSVELGVACLLLPVAFRAEWMGYGPKDCYSLLLSNS